MDYLKIQFHEFLNEDGEVNVAGYPFFRDVILRELEQQGYRDSFDDWLIQRKGENLARAEVILSQFDNGPRFRKLKEIYQRGAIIPFVGAGMSMPSGYPSWTAFLYEILDDTRILKTDFDKLMRSGQYEEAAQELNDALPHGCFLERVENAFGLDNDLSGPVQRLPYLFKSAVITTNFDDVLFRCYSNADTVFGEELLGVDAQELPRLLGEGKRPLVKLHGKANSSRKRVLTKAEYDEHYANEAGLEAVIEAISNRTLLFIGCNLTVDRTLRSLSSIVQRKGIEKVPRHYAFLRLNEGDDRLARRNELAKANIFPIWYTEDHDECIEALLEKLADDN